MVSLPASAGCHIWLVTIASNCSEQPGEKIQDPRDQGRGVGSPAAQPQNPRRSGPLLRGSPEQPRSQVGRQALGKGGCLHGCLCLCLGHCPRFESPAPGPAACTPCQGSASHLKGNDTALSIPQQRLPAWWLIMTKWTHYHGF